MSEFYSSLLGLEDDKTSSTDLSSCDGKEGIFCETCNIFIQRSESYKSHLYSTSHIISRKDLSAFPASFAVCKASRDSVGFQILKKQGWDETKGLGAHEQGIVKPLNALVRSKRTGLGVNDPKCKSVEKILKPRETTTEEARSKSEKPRGNDRHWRSNVIRYLSNP